jgi:DNA invertase Pin-like site-specific DNA recombinase
MMEGELKLPPVSPPVSHVSEKIKRRHQERQAIVYVRQSTVQQIERHQESTRLQYALADRAFHLGWARGDITVIDDDLGRSGASIEGRVGFQRLVAEVGLGHVGLILGVEMSRLARSCRDWHQLLEICAIFDTLIADADGVYDPGNYNDRLLLGLKGTMSEAELHILKARMLEGRRAKARRGEKNLALGLDPRVGKAVPIGYVRRPSGEVAFDPDEQAQTTVRLMFDLFERFKTAGKVMRYMIDHDIKLPVRLRSGPGKGDLEWHRVNRVSLNNLFRNPIYAGAYTYGLRAIDKRRQKPGRPGTGRRPGRLEHAEVCLQDRLPAYISWDRYVRNQAQLASNKATSTGAVRAGQALLSGLLVCGRCGLRMMVQYSNNGQNARYICGRMSSEYGEAVCQSVKGAPLDDLIGKLVLQALTPAALEATLAVATNVEAERASLERQWQQRLERARYECTRARRQYDAVDPDNRLVARTLERQWEEALAEHIRLEADYERHQRQKPHTLTKSEIQTIQDLALDLPTVWQAGAQEERQTIVRLLLKRVLVTVIDKSEQVQCQCHWHGGCRTDHALIRPVRRIDSLSTYPGLVAKATELHQAGQSLSEIAAMLNKEGWRPPKRRDTFNSNMVRQLLLKVGVITVKYRRPTTKPDRHDNEWTISELARHLCVPEPTVYSWVQKGRLSSRLVPAAGRRPIKLVHADADTIAALKTIRATPPPWRRLPTPANTPKTTNSNS